MGTNSRNVGKLNLADSPINLGISIFWNSTKRMPKFTGFPYFNKGIFWNPTNQGSLSGTQSTLSRTVDQDKLFQTFTVHWWRQALAIKCTQHFLEIESFDHSTPKSCQMPICELEYRWEKSSSISKEAALNGAPESFAGIVTETSMSRRLAAAADDMHRREPTSDGECIPRNCTSPSPARGCRSWEASRRFSASVKQ